MEARKNTTGRIVGLTLAGLLVASSMLYVACDDSSSGTVKEPNPVPDSGVLADGAPIPVIEAGPLPDGAIPETGPNDCFAGVPTTHLEIINACTDAVRITKKPTLPRLLADGGLPPLM